ncbi:hypothetical protein [Pontibacter anaerobius]|uniref:Uncharacterized protein n=1 Tax=Pontibacter anaerobius TaxID=2993940 RepID=A0ABT3RAA9_9BACT|nr:hypothetical protein [Pontibacter anaerobius]MCX2738451.1 hypothetical protein [Pontibacter anaerobius]
MNTLKTLQMVLTTLLLVLATLALDWQERAALKRMLAAAEPEKEMTSAKLSVYTNCCLQHALHAAEGHGELVGRTHPANLMQVFEQGSLLLLKSDSTKHIAVAR